MAYWREHIKTRYLSPGVVAVDLDTNAYGMVGAHWKKQLKGRNARKWGRLFIDPCPHAKAERRRDALAPFRRLFEGEGANNNDECPGAMFITETNRTSAVQPSCASSNQQFGRDLYWALCHAIHNAPGSNRPGNAHQQMAWWEVKFQFDGAPKAQ